MRILCVESDNSRWTESDLAMMWTLCRKTAVNQLANWDPILGDQLSFWTSCTSINAWCTSTTAWWEWTWKDSRPVSCRRAVGGFTRLAWLLLTRLGTCCSLDQWKDAWEAIILSGRLVLLGKLKCRCWERLLYFLIRKWSRRLGLITVKLQGEIEL